LNTDINVDDFYCGKKLNKTNLTYDYKGQEGYSLATSRDQALDQSMMSNRRIKSDIRMDDDPIYQYKFPVYKNYKKKPTKFNNKENEPMHFSNKSYDNLAKFNEYKKAKANKIPIKSRLSEN